MTIDVIEQVALITGRVIHAGTGRAVVGRVWITAREVSIIDKLLPDGTFVVSGQPSYLFPSLSSQPFDLNLTIHVDSPQYRQRAVEQSIPALTIPAGTTFEPLLDVGTIELPADPVNIRGRVTDATDPTVGIAGATVDVSRGGVVTNTTTTSADGRYRFDEIAVRAPAELRCAAAGFVTETRPLLPDFGRLVNEEYFRLAPP